MRRNNPLPVVAKPTKRRRLIELGKDLLIVVLTCSALFLAGRTPLFTQLRGWVDPPARVVEAGERQPGDAVMPYGIGARNSLGLYGVIYDDVQVRRAFEELSPLLGEGLSTAGEPERIARWKWRELLEKPGIYCVFQGDPPLSALFSWMGEEGTVPEGRAQSLLLAWDSGQVKLCWREEEGYYLCSTRVAYEGHMEAVLEEFNPNGAAYAYMLAQTDRAFASVDPDVLVPMTAPQPKGYTASSPNLVGDGEVLGQLLTALGFQSGVGSAYEVGGGLAINESGDRLRISEDGTVTFHAGEETRYPVAFQGGEPTGEEAAMAAWTLLESAAAPWKGETAFVLTEVEEMAAGWTITFQSRLEGIPVQTGTEGWCAQFTVKGGAVSDFTLLLRSYGATEETLLIPGQRLAAAAMNAPVYEDSGKKLTLCYRDGGGAALTVGWTAEE